MLSTVTILLLASMLLNEIIRKATKENKDGVQFLVILFLISPASLLGMWSSNNFGRLEYYCLLLTLVAIFGFEKMKNVYRKYFVVTCLSCISMAIYQGYVFMFYSMILMLFVYEGLKETDHIWLRRLLGFISATITGMSFLFFQFYNIKISN